MAKTIRLIDTDLVLLPERALWLPDYRTLVVADWHLGKSTHFRKAGIFMPSASVDKDVLRIQSLLDRYAVDTVVFLGDLFHSDLNSEWLVFERFRMANPSIRFILTRGNHDILPDDLLEKAAVDVVASYSIAPHIHCTHHPEENGFAGRLNLAGHVHPGCLIPAKGRQAYRLPCFYYREQILLLPAFGSLTGLYLVQPARHARIYPIAGDQVWEWGL
ncbi:MAG TPA: ligase-associated DNA damage response endonuclease PdeM [Parapedobacter sp.]|uniref:ligase-associated DNA damage response endonuclease PdeM n=1 Tax=Parapedobacter sp. TaxID=1958893 RepID=UPI002BE62ABD|nr:ligase-associated DNA damage response endonuclease PdeM [Parapedobacter sp.]HWK56224.1 ligase-associated DNA damage response endonuclease PdeM [Parapedobacter sp.]